MFKTMLIRILVTPKADICQHELHVTVFFLEEFCSMMSNIIKLILVVLNYYYKLSVSHRVAAWHELPALPAKFSCKTITNQVHHDRPVRSKHFNIFIPSRRRNEFLQKNITQLRVEFMQANVLAQILNNMRCLSFFANFKL